MKTSLTLEVKVAEDCVSREKDKMITQREISQIAYLEKMSDRVIEKDYVITWLLLALADSPLRDMLAFKGGTALKKNYFPDYRYSEDLDFTIVKNTDPISLLRGLSDTLKELAESRGFQFDLPEKRIERRMESVTAYVNFVGPLGARLESRDIKIDFTLKEELLFPTDAKMIHSRYSDIEKRKIPTYSLEEILVEKLCAIIGRTEPRDIYDAHFLLGLRDINLYEIPQAFKVKAESKNIGSYCLSDALSKKQAKFAKMWETRLKNQVKAVPYLEEVLRELKRKLKEYDI